MSRKIAYVAGEYPLVSLTFIQREIAGLRAHGLTVVTCSMRRTPVEQHKGPAEKEAAETTFYVLEKLKQPLALLRAQKSLFQHPGRYFSALRLAWRTRAPGLKAALYQLIYFFEATVLARHFKAEGVDHIHAHFTTGATTATMLASELSGLPYSFTLHGPADFLDPYRWKIGEKASRARFVATISHYARSQLMFHTPPEHWDRLHIIHCGVDPARYHTEAAPVPRDDGKTRLIFVGRIAPVKGLRLLIEALNRLQNPNLHLILVGDGPDRKVIEDAARPLGDQVEFTGYLDQAAVAEKLKTADIAVLPSFAEGVPVFLMEAFASGLPVISTQVAGMSELVKNGESGLIVPPGDVEGLMQAIQTLAADPDRRQNMGATGRQHVITEFDIHEEAARMATLFLGQGEGRIRPAPMSDTSGQ